MHIEEHREEWDTSPRKRRKPAFGIKRVLLFFAFIGAVIFILLPVAIQKSRDMDLTYCISQGHYVYSVMMDFEADHGSFPDDATAASTAKLQGFQGSYSNDYLGQLIAGGYIKTEQSFYACDDRFKRRKADEIIDPPTRILEKNECGFSYVMVEDMGKRSGLRTSDHGNLPVLVMPLVNEWGSFEKKTFSGRGAIIRVDGSSRAEPLRESDQKIQMKDGGTLFDSGPGMFWDELKPLVHLPKRG